MSRRTRRNQRPHGPVAPKASLETAVATSAVAAAGLAILAAPSAEAATFTVTNLNDSGSGSLRQAIFDANATAGPDVVTFQAAVTGTITLTSGQLYINDSLDLQGPGASTVTVSGNNSSRVFYIYSSGNAPIDVTLSGLTITQGAANVGAGVVNFDENVSLDHVVVTNNTATSRGGGVATGGTNGTLQILNSTISGNNAPKGGGIYLYDIGSPALITDSVISGNNATAGQGGGIYLYGPNYDVTIVRTTISGNTAAASGGGIYFYDTDGGSVIIDSSTISGNTAGGNGGGIYFYNVDDPVTIINTTISGNSATNGGGVYFYSVSQGAAIQLSTIAGNSATNAGGNVVNNGNAVTIENSIIADGTAPTDADISGGVYTINYTLIETPGSASFSGTGNITGVDPQLGPLANNGGPTLTKLPAIGSPVVDAGDPAFVKPPAFDQRGENRISGPRVDMGAVEIQGGTIQLSTATYSVAENGGSVTITVNRTGGTDPASVQYTTSNGTATAGADYTATTGTLNFAAGQTSATFNVPILDDQLVEGNETFNVTLSTPSAGATLGAQTSAVVTITDFEEGHLQFSAATTSVNETGGNVSITVTRVGGSDGAVSAHYQTSNGTATAGADYTATSGNVNFAGGSTTPQSFNVPILTDALVEGNETFNVNLSAPTGGATLGSPATEVVTIVDSINPGSVQFTTPATAVPESAGTVAVTIQRTGGSDGPLTVNYTTSNGTATAPSDYTTTTGSVTFLASDSAPKTVNIPIVSDSIPEPPETFTVTLSMPTAGTLGPQSTTTVTITPPLQEIPALGPIGKLLLALSTMASALVIMGRRRIFGFLFAAMMIGAMTQPLFAAKPVVHPVVRTKAGGHNPHNLAKNKMKGILEEIVPGKIVTLKLAGGVTVTVPDTQLSVSLNGATSSVSALAKGQKITIVTMTDQKGNVMRVKVKIKG